MALKTLPHWALGYGRRLVWTDAGILAATLTVTQLIWFGFESAELRTDMRLSISYTVVSVIVGTAWMAGLTVFATRDHKVIGIGVGEYRAVADATIRVFGVLAITAFLLQAQLARGYFLTALPMGLFLLLFGRWCWRQWLVRRRSRGELLSAALLIGSPGRTELVAGMLGRHPAAGIRAAGVILPDGRRGDEVAGLPVLGGLVDILDALNEIDAEYVVLTGSDELSHRAVKRLSWALEAHGVQLIVVPALNDVAGPRIHTAPVAGLPLIHVAFPEFTGTKYLTKRVVDVVGSVLMLAVLWLPMLVIAVAVRVSSSGPALFRQTRVGLNGREFTMYKFRTMVTNAEELLPALIDHSDGNGVLFKKHDDPRVTPLGRLLRRSSLDELPQLLNVLRGDMSIVGPRPPLLEEVEKYDKDARRRLLVKPGLTGLWQVSGRSDLTWDDSVRLDLYYVENWSLTGDIIIIYRTLRAVLLGNGAY